jgi:hypothetical protein
MAMERIERRLRQVTAALDAAGIRYAVVGGNAVALWVAKADPAATRTTKDVDLLVRRDDLDRISEVMRGLGFESQDLRPLVLFIDPEEPSRKSEVHLVWAGEKVRPSYAHPTPLVTEAVRDTEGFWVLDLPALLRMKLTSMRDVDRVHVADLIRVGMVDHGVRDALPSDLRGRLEEIEHTIDDDE